MRKLSLGTLLMGIVVLLCTLLSAAQATPPIAVQGTFDYTFEVTDMKEADENTWLYAIEYED